MFAGGPVHQWYQPAGGRWLDSKVKKPENYEDIMSKFHRNKKKKSQGQDKRALWLLAVAFVAVIFLFAFL